MLFHFYGKKEIANFQMIKGTVKNDKKTGIISKRSAPPSLGNRVNNHSTVLFFEIDISL